MALSSRISLGAKSHILASISVTRPTILPSTKALKLISDSELLVRQIKGIYKVKNAVLQDLHGRAKELIAQLEWFSIGHALREQNTEADRLANEAMDKGMGRSVARVPAPASTGGCPAQELEGIIRNGVVEFTNGKLPEGTRVQVRAKK